MEENTITPLKELNKIKRKQSNALSSVQKRTIELMRQGYEIGVYGNGCARVVMQKGGINSGGPTEPIQFTTFKRLLNKSYIVEKPGRLPGSKLTTYELTGLGKTANLY